MEPEEITARFDQQAETYDEQWSRLSAINGALHLLTQAVLAELPRKAHVLCVGAGTGAEILSLAKVFPDWRFTAVEPSAPMLEVFRRKAESHGIMTRCILHAGHLDSLPGEQRFDAATSFLVSQFILKRDQRAAFFAAIAQRLRPDGLLVSSDLAGDLQTPGCQRLLEVWFRVLSSGGVPAAGVQCMREAYGRDVAVLPAAEVSDILGAGGFSSPIQFFQAGLIHAWFARRVR